MLPRPASLRALTGIKHTFNGSSNSSCIGGNIRRASTHVAAFKKKGDEKKQERRKKSIGGFKPLVPAQVTKISEAVADFRLGSNLPDIPVLKKGSLVAESTNTVLQFPTDEGSPGNAFGLPRNVLFDFRLLSKPCAVVREATVGLTKSLNNAAAGSSSASRRVLTGPSGCGKSYLLLQAATHCAANDWIVLYVPRAQKLIDSSSSYYYDPKTQTYLQPVISYQLLRRLQTSNKVALKALKLDHEIIFEKRKPIEAGVTLGELIDMGLKEQHIAPSILSVLLSQLEKQSQFPVLVAVDEIQSLYCRSKYRNQHFERIQSYHLSIPRLLMEYASGKRSFKRGAFLSAVSTSDTQFPTPNELRQTLNRTSDTESLNSYSKLSPALLEYASGLQAVPVPAKLTYKEATAMFELWGSERALHTNFNDELFLSKLSEASGNARNFVHGGLLASLTS